MKEKSYSSRHQAQQIYLLRRKLLILMTDVEAFLNQQMTPQIDLGAMVDDVFNSQKAAHCHARG